MPKALSPFADEDEKTTIESGWEEEASTTVEQGEVAEKIRTLGLRPITNVTGSTSNGGVLDEPTMDDQHAAAGLSLITPPMLQARMIVTAGNDQGQEIEIVPGKTYTVGRSIDNDIVLTDIAVSRKHFDLRFENASWVLIDRGSGNGTVINGNIEDAPFMLANGDSIEIGNTTFRFDNPNGIPRHAFNENLSTSGFNGTGGFAVASDVVTRDGAMGFGDELEEEPSTVAGKPLREISQEMPQHLNSSFARSESPRVRAPSALPAPVRPKTVPPPMPPPAPLPRPKVANSGPPPFGGGFGSMPPQSSPALPQMQPQMLQAPPPIYTAQPVPSIGPNRATMLAGQGPSQDQILQNVMPTTIPGQGPPIGPSNPQLHAMPFTYPNLANMSEHAQHAQHAQHPSSPHAKMLVISQNGMPPRDATATAHVPPTPYNGLPVMQPYVAPSVSRRTKLLLGGAALTLIAAIATIAIIKGVSGGDTKPEDETKPDVTNTETKPTAQPIDDKAKKDPPKEALKKDPPKEALKKDPPKEALKKDPPEAVKKDPPKEIKKDPPKEAVKEPPKEIKKDPPKEIKKDPPKEVVKKDPPKEIKKDPPKEVVKKDPPKRVAIATVKKDPPPADNGALEKAKALYAQKNFLGAAAAAAPADRNIAAIYTNLAKSYNAGMRQTAQGADAYQALQRAIHFDDQLGGNYRAELRQRQAEVAKGAALSFVNKGMLVDAASAVKLAESVGKDTKLEQQLINGKAKDLYDQAVGEMDSNKAAAIAKLRIVIAVLPATNTTRTKAQTLIKANGG